MEQQRGAGNIRPCVNSVTVHAEENTYCMWFPNDSPSTLFASLFEYHTMLIRCIYIADCFVKQRHFHTSFPPSLALPFPEEVRSGQTEKATGHSSHQELCPPTVWTGYLSDGQSRAWSLASASSLQCWNALLLEERNPACVWQASWAAGPCMSDCTWLWYVLSDKAVVYLRQSHVALGKQWGI